MRHRRAVPCVKVGKPCDAVGKTILPIVPALAKALYVERLI
jgi:hypothetical protein